MNPGKLNQRIVIEQKSVARGAAGGEVISWIMFATVWAEAQPIRGREFAALRAAQADITVRFRIRYLAGVSAAMRVRWNGAYYDIVEPPIDVGGARTVYELMCRGVDPNG